MSWWFSRGWEEYFTIVQWDQRAAGKTQLSPDYTDAEIGRIWEGNVFAALPRRRLHE
jgi:hypothetical protein